MMLTNVRFGSLADILRCASGVMCVIILPRWRRLSCPRAQARSSSRRWSGQAAAAIGLSAAAPARPLPAPGDRPGAITRLPRA